MIMRISNILLYVIVVMLCSCGKVVEQDFFIYSLSEVDLCKSEYLLLEDTIISSSTFPMSYIVDSLMISMDRAGQEFIFSVTDLYSDETLGLFGRRGRSFNELIDCLPVMDVYRNSKGELCSDLFSYRDGRLFIWNISESLMKGTDSYDRIIELNNVEEEYPFLSLYRLDEMSVIAKNSYQIAISDNVLKAPRYEIYNLSTGDLEKTFDIFHKVNIVTNDPIYTSKSFLGNFDCIKPDRTKLAFGMGYMPVYGILDLNTGKFKGFKIKGLKRFSTSVRNWHFCNLVSDNSYIYALYYGHDISDPSSERLNSTLFIFDWEGNMIERYDLGHYFTELNLSNDTLYFMGKEGRIYTILTSKIYPN